MGWLFFRKPENVKAYLDAQFTYQTNGGDAFRVIDSAIVNRVEYYAAIESVSPEGARNVFAAVCLLKFLPRAADGYTFGYKDMSENCGPNASRCPARILVALTETTNEYANAWRARCREYHAARAAKPKLVDGAVLEVENAPEYYGVKLDRVTVVRGGYSGKRLFFRHETLGLFRWPSFRQFNYRLAAN